MNRRQIFQLIGLMPLWPVLPGLATSERFSARSLILLELKGGNDGLNTLIPVDDDHYYRARPTIAIKKSEAVLLNDGFGMHPALLSLKPIWTEGDLAWIMGLGYPTPNRSHFRSIEIWETGSDANAYLDDGWLARLLAHLDNPLTGISLDNDLGPLVGHTGSVVLHRQKLFTQQAKRRKTDTPKQANTSLKHILAVRSRTTAAAQLLEERISSMNLVNVAMPKTAIGNQLRRVLELQQTGLPISVFKVSLGSFDTHAAQVPTHARLLDQLADALSEYTRQAKRFGLWESSLLVTYSEFGRRVSENGSSGTDHGTAAPHLIIGGAVRGGLYGKHPDLVHLDNGDFSFTLDFRQLYGTLARKWLNIDADEYSDYPDLAVVE